MRNNHNLQPIGITVHIHTWLVCLSTFHYLFLRNNDDLRTSENWKILLSLQRRLKIISLNFLSQNNDTFRISVKILCENLCSSLLCINVFWQPSLAPRMVAFNLDPLLWKIKIVFLFLPSQHIYSDKLLALLFSYTFLSFLANYYDSLVLNWLTVLLAYWNVIGLELKQQICAKTGRNMIQSDEKMRSRDRRKTNEHNNKKYQQWSTKTNDSNISTIVVYIRKNLLD